MTGEFTTAGDVVTGGLIARAVEPAAGEAESHGIGGLCLNCGTRRVGGFCHRCGQTGNVHNSFNSILHDLLHGVFHFEGKIWHTLPMLVLRPGALTRRYIAGERARFVSPLAIFLFSVFLMFAVVAQLPGWNLGQSEWLQPGVANGMAQARTKLAEEKARAETALQTDQARLAKARGAVPRDAERIAKLERRVATTTKARDDIGSAERALPRVATTFALDETPPAASDNWLEQKWRHAKENPQLLLYKVKTSAYKYSWALIPISLPFIWLLFPLRRDVGLYDHAIFATYSLTFMSLLVIALAVLVAIGLPGWVAWTAAAIAPPFHIYKQLKGAYGLGRIGALWRTFWMLNFAVITSGLFIMALLSLGLAD